MREGRVRVRVRNTTWALYEHYMSTIWRVSITNRSLQLDTKKVSLCVRLCVCTGSLGVLAFFSFGRTTSMPASSHSLAYLLI